MKGCFGRFIARISAGARREQVFDDAVFAEVAPGLSRDEVLQIVGPPTEEQSFANLGEDVVSWRYVEFGNRAMFFNAHFDRSGRLKYTSRTPDPRQSG